jgi:protein-S-isoprenylcysteine O-methyltransferase Ste14
LIITAGLIWDITPITLFMYSILLFSYFLLAKTEEKELMKKYGELYLKYKQETGMFFPKIIH